MEERQVQRITADVSVQVGESNGVNKLWKHFNGNFDKLLEAGLASYRLHTFLALKQGVTSDIHGEDMRKILLSRKKGTVSILKYAWSVTHNKCLPFKGNYFTRVLSDAGEGQLDNSSSV